MRMFIYDRWEDRLKNRLKPKMGTALLNQEGVLIMRHRNQSTERVSPVVFGRTAQEYVSTGSSDLGRHAALHAFKEPIREG